MREFKVLQDDKEYIIWADRISEFSDNILRFSITLGDRERTCAIFNEWKNVIEISNEMEFEKV